MRSESKQYQALFCFDDMDSLLNSIRGMVGILGAFPDRAQIDFTLITPSKKSMEDPHGDKGYIGFIFKSVNGATSDLLPYQASAMSGARPMNALSKDEIDAGSNP